MICPHGRWHDACVPCNLATGRPTKQKRRGMPAPYEDSGSPKTRGPEVRSDAHLQDDFRDTTDSLAGARKRLTRLGRPPGTEPSRHARYRRRHPEYAERERQRKATLTRTSTNAVETAEGE